MITTRQYTVAQLEAYIDWSYFLHAWQMPVGYASLGHLHQCEACRRQWLAENGQANQAQALEAMRLVDDARQMLFTLGQKAMVKARVGLFDCNSDGDDICIVADNGSEARIPCLRQQHSTEGKPNWCMADFIRPKEQGISDRIGVFATTVDFIPEEEYAGDSYNTMLSQTLCDRLAEAAACLFHKEVRTSIWGYSPDEELSIEDMLRERNQGIRPAVGYPSLPDQSLNFIMSPLIQMNELGIKLTENGAMKPHASVCGLMIAHPKADYFMIGKIDHNQFADYAERRGLPLEQMRKFLAGNLE